VSIDRRIDQELARLDAEMRNYRSLPEASPYMQNRLDMGRKVHEFARERALLLGGECDWRTVDVRPEQTELLVALPEKRPLDKVVYDEVEALSGVPIRCDLKVARYVRSYYLEHKKQVVGCIFEWDETR